MTALQRRGVLLALDMRPPGAKVQCAALARSLGLAQADVIAAIERLIADGRLEPVTLRTPPPPSPVQAVAHPPAVSGSDLVDQLEAFIARHRLSKTRVSLKLFGSRAQINQVRAVTPHQKTIDKVLAFLAAPPDDDLKAIARTIQRPARIDRPAAGDAVANARRGVRLRQTAKTEAQRILAADPDAKSGRNASVTSAIGAIREQQASAARAADPIEQAKLALRRRGRVVFNACVHGGRKGRFIVSGLRDEATGKQRQLTDIELIDLARRVNPQAMAEVQGRASQ